MAVISGGEAQRLNVARAFLTSRFGMVLDEPSASKDYQGVEQLVRHWKSISKSVSLRRPRSGSRSGD